MEILSLSLSLSLSSSFLPSLPSPLPVYGTFLPFTIFLFSLTAIQFGSVLFGSVNTLSISISLCLLVLFAFTLPLNSTQHNTNTIFTQVPACRSTGWPFLAGAAFPVSGLVILSSPLPYLTPSFFLCTILLAIAGGFFEGGGVRLG